MLTPNPKDITTVSRGTTRITLFDFLEHMKERELNYLEIPLPEDRHYMVCLTLVRKADVHKLSAAIAGVLLQGQSESRYTLPEPLDPRRDDVGKIAEND